MLESDTDPWAGAREAFQQRIDAVPVHGTLTLDGHEYPGPVSFSRPIVVEGRGATIWALAGPVVSIRSADVALRGVRIEVTNEARIGEPEAWVAIDAAHDAIVDGVTVRGTVRGLAGEDGPWRYPTRLEVAELAPDAPQVRRFRISVPTACRIVSEIGAVSFHPVTLPGAGPHEIEARFEAMGADVLVSGWMHLDSPRLRRSIKVEGRVRSGAALEVAEASWQPDDWAEAVAEAAAPVTLRFSDPVAGARFVSPTTPRPAPPSPAPVPAIASTPPAREATEPPRVVRSGEKPLGGLFGTPAPLPPASSEPPAPPSSHSPGRSPLGAAFVPPAPPNA